MTDFSQLAKSAYEHIRFLVEEIGPRPVGSGAERKAQNYIHDRLMDYGLNPQRLPASYAQLPFLYLPYILAGILIILGGWFYLLYPYLAILAPVMFYVLPTINRWIFRYRRAPLPSTNLFASTHGPSDWPIVILCAHIDTARVMGFRSRFFRVLYQKTNYILQRVAFLIGLLSLVQIAQIPAPDWVYPIVGIAGSLAGGWLIFTEIANQFFHRNQYSPGANDNASGVGAALAAAEYFSTHAPQTLRVGFLFSTAEETGLYGAESFARNFPFDPKRSSVLSLDMVGAGNILYLVTRDGTLFSMKTDERLNVCMRAASPEIKDYWYSQRSGDFSAFLRHKIPATALQSGGSNSAELAYHTLEDTLDLVSLPMLEKVIRSVVSWIELINQQNLQSPKIK